MDADLKIIKHYLTMCMEGKSVRIVGDIAFEINDAFDSLSRRLEALEAAERSRKPLRATPMHGLGAVGGE